MSVRSQLAEIFTEILPQRFKVIAEPRELDALSAREPVVQIIRTTVEPLTRVRARSNTFAVWVIQPKQIDAEDALDDDLDEVLAVLDGDARLLWTSAERSTFVRNDDGSSAYPAYRINLTLATSVQIKE